MNKKSLLIMAVCILMCTVFLGLSVNAGLVLAEGKIGDNLTWTIEHMGDVTIEGYGEMYSRFSMKKPWFNYIDDISEVEFSGNVTNVGSHMFYECTALKYIDFENRPSVSSIGPSGRIDKMETYDSVTVIEDHAFYGCTALPGVNLPNRLKTIDVCAFANCTSLKRISIPDSVTYIGEGAFENCSSLEEFNVGNNNEFYTSDEAGALFNKDMTELIQFPAKSSVTSYAIPGSVTRISNRAFKDCAFLTSVFIPDSVTSIGEGVFENCTALINIRLPNGIKKFGAHMFRGCTALTSIEIPDGTIMLREKLFAGCSSLEKVIIPASVLKIDGSEDYFSYLYGYNSAEEAAVFSECPKLTIYGYTGSYAEEYARQLGIHFVSLGNYVRPAERIIIDSGIDFTQTWTLDNEATLTLSSKVGTGVNHIPDDFGQSWHDYSDIIKTVIIENGITCLRNCAFFECHNLEKVFIPPSVIKIDGPYEPYSYTAGGLVAALPNKDLTIYGYSGTHAEDYALNYNIPFYSLGNYEYPAERTIVDYGTCGDNITWTLDDQRTLTLSGTGVIDLGEEMPEDYGPWWFSAPWDHYITAVKKIVINEGITGIDDSALREGRTVESVVLPMSLTDFSAWDFNGADNMTFYGYKGSYAESVAVQNNIPFVAINGYQPPAYVPEIKLPVGENVYLSNGIATPLDVPAQLINSRTMVPLRAIFEALGAYVHWEDSTQTITAIKDDTVVILVIGKNSINVNGVDKPLDVPAMLVDSRTLVPARAVAESFGCDVLWDDATQTVTIR